MQTALTVNHRVAYAPPMPASHTSIPGAPDARRPLLLAFHGRSLLGRAMYNKDAAFTEEERDWFGLNGLLPVNVLTLERAGGAGAGARAAQGDDPLEQYIGLAALQDRNETLFYRLLAENLEELLPIVYTPTVGPGLPGVQPHHFAVRAASGSPRTTSDRIPELLRNAAHAGGPA